MVNHRHYVPVLRWRRAERAALEKLDASAKAALTPLLEFPPLEFDLNEPTNGWEVDKALRAIVESIDASWGLSPVFVDCHLTPDTMRDSDGAHIVTALWGWAKLYGLAVVPVTGLHRSATFQAATREVLKAANGGLCLRLSRQDLSSPLLTNDVYSVLGTLDQSAQETDLVVDMGVATAEMPSLLGTSQRLPSLENWRSVTVLSGGFRKNLDGLALGRNDLPRWDWQWWSAEVQKLSHSIKRTPRFGDYAIQHAVFEDPPEKPNVSASIRYTCPEYWLVMRGQGLRTPGSPKHKQYPAAAHLLIDMSEYLGRDFSYGDEYIWRIATGGGAEPGNPETWLRAGINHHLTFVVRQLAEFWKNKNI